MGASHRKTSHRKGNTRTIGKQKEKKTKRKEGRLPIM
jgi:hypothetical protein